MENPRADSVVDRVDAEGYEPDIIDDPKVGEFHGLGAVTYGPYGIRVNSVCPGTVEAPMSEGHEANQPMIDATPLRRGATPEEIAPGVLFLASDESRFVTGTELIMDGGYLAVW